MVKKILIGICIVVTAAVVYYVIQVRTLAKAAEKGLITFNTEE